MANQRIHIVPHDQGWAVKREGSNNIESVHTTQKDAIDAGREVSRNDEVDLVVHRQDGTFRNVLSYTSEAYDMNSNGHRVEAHDVVSVGSRVSWSAILAGAAIALSLNALLWMGGAALGVTMVEQSNVGVRALTIGGAIWAFASSLISVFLGGYVVSRVTTGENATEAVLYGAVLWGFMFACMMALATAGTAIGAAALVNTEATGAGDALLSEEMLRKANLSESQIADVRANVQEARAGDLSPTMAAWWAFASGALSLAAAIGGSILGCGPGFGYYFTRRTTTRTTVAHPA